MYRTVTATMSHTFKHFLATVATVAVVAALAPSVADAAPRAGTVAKKSEGKRVARTFTGKRRSVMQVIIPARPSYGQLAGLHSVQDQLDLKSSVALVIDQDTREVLFSKNDSAVLPIASLTKLMTGLIISEAKLPMDETITITQDDVDTEKGSSSRLRVGAMLTRGELLHLALMSSENRAAHALGRTYPGGLGAFVSVMNAKAKMLGMKDTRYVEPTGLSSQNQSSATDLAMLVNTAYADSTLREYSTSPGHQVAVGNRTLQFNNTNRLVKNPAWEIGLQKTGYISEAGQCLVMQARIAGRKLIMVFLDSAGKLSRIADAERVRKWVETHPVVPAGANTVIRQVYGYAGENAKAKQKRPRAAFVFASASSGGAGAGDLVPQGGGNLLGRGLQLAEPAFVQPVGRRRDRQARDQAALVIVDSGRHAAHAEFQLLVVARDPLLPGLGQLPFEQRQLRDAVLGVAGQARARGVGPYPLRIVGGQEQLAGGSQVQRCAAADGAHHLHAGALAVGTLDVNDFVALPHAQVHGLLDQLVKLAHGHKGGVAHAQSSLHQVAQFQQAHPQPVAARLRTVDKAAGGQVVQDPVRGRWMQARLRADLLQRDRLFARRQHVDQRKHARDHLDGGSRRSARVCFSHGNLRGVDPMILSCEIERPRGGRDRGPQEAAGVPGTHCPSRKTSCGL
jgi:D-alanyl-D-alanine endopeptidase (penicillin-binding protein 7)